MLFEGIKREALKRGLNRLNVEASITAKPFFLKMGFSVINEQKVKMRGAAFTHFQMEKYL